MARETGAMITYNDAIYMVNNEGFTTNGVAMGSNKCMTRAEIESFFTNVDSSNFSSYTSNQLVPYHLIQTESGDTESPVFHTITGSNNGLYISDKSANHIFCHWKVTDNVGVTSHRIYFKAYGESWQYITENSLIPDANGDYNYMLHGLNPNTSYEVYVRAYDAAGNYTNSSSDFETTSTPNSTLPEFSSNLTYDNLNSQLVDLYWEMTDDVAVTQLRLYQRENGGTWTYTTIHNTSITVLGVTVDSGISYDMYLRAYNSDGIYVNSNIVSFTAPSDTPMIG